MSDRSKTLFLAGEFLTENTVRDVFGRRRLTLVRNDIEPVKGPPTDPRIGAQEMSRSAVGPPPLRRWSVAELIARAAARPPRTA